MAIEGAEIVKAAGFIGAGLAMGLGAIWLQPKHVRPSAKTPRKPAC
jgi:hypothetical protein